MSGALAYLGGKNDDWWLRSASLILSIQIIIDIVGDWLGGKKKTRNADDLSARPWPR